jgi:hypothetical protein
MTQAVGLLQLLAGVTGRLKDREERTPTGNLQVAAEGAGAAHAARIVMGAVVPIPWRGAAGGAGDRRIARQLCTRRRAADAALSAEEPLIENDYKVQIAALVRRSILRAADVSEEPA